MPNDWRKEYCKRVLKGQWDEKRKICIVGEGTAVEIKSINRRFILTKQDPIECILYETEEFSSPRSLVKAIVKEVKKWGTCSDFPIIEIIDTVGFEGRRVRLYVRNLKLEEALEKEKEESKHPSPLSEWVIPNPLWGGEDHSKPKLIFRKLPSKPPTEKQLEARRKFTELMKRKRES